MAGVKWTKKLTELLDKRIEQAERYHQISSKMVYEDIDGVTEMLDRREKLIAKIDGISAEIKSYVNAQSVERKELLEDMFSFKEVGELSGELLEIQERLLKYKEIKHKINEADKEIYKHLKQMQNELAAEMNKSNRSKQVIDYFSQTSIDVNKGRKLNTSN